MGGRFDRHIQDGMNVFMQFPNDRTLIYDITKRIAFSFITWPCDYSLTVYLKCYSKY